MYYQSLLYSTYYPLLFECFLKKCPATNASNTGSKGTTAKQKLTTTIAKSKLGLSEVEFFTSLKIVVL